VRFSFGAIQRLKAYDWPGNIRELKNVVARAGAIFAKQDVTEELIDQLIDKPVFTPTPIDTLGGKNVIKDVEKQLILTTLATNQGNQRRTADQLGIPKSTLHDRLKTYGVNPKEVIF
jgi:DNA-binding NtrC family response regulator